MKHLKAEEGTEQKNKAEANRTKRQYVDRLNGLAI